MTVGQKLSELNRRKTASFSLYALFPYRSIALVLLSHSLSVLSSRIHLMDATAYECTLQYQISQEKCTKLSHSPQGGRETKTKQLLYRYMNLKHIYFNLSMEFVFFFSFFSTRSCYFVCNEAAISSVVFVYNFNH